jgi:undecaprenyl-diphosphatase
VIKNHKELTSGHVDWGLVGVGFVVSFLVAIVVIRWFVGLISRRGFAPFAWYRIVAGSIALVWLLAR